MGETRRFRTFPPSSRIGGIRLILRMLALLAVATRLRRGNDRRRGPNDLNAAGDGSTISAARLSQSRSIAGGIPAPRRRLIPIRDMARPAGAPPPPRQEAVPPPPGATMVRQPGYWSWRRHGWVWVSGNYVSCTYPGTYWVPGHWRQRHGGWIWVPGTGDDIAHRCGAQGQLGARVIVVGADALFFSECDQIVAAASHHVIPAIYGNVNSPRPVD
jgi:WXXGXW repeat (2 copies)